ncbi:MAG: L-serine ammonia-lyase [Hyphomicrobiaceae bacterium]|nr:L-serine ammonia-lyase [Hyphomicrobiaceae bacterium]
MFLSVFELFKVGIGPSSSHTVGPMVAARRFAQSLSEHNLQPERIMVELYGSLAFTGKGHASDIAIVLGLAGKRPDTVSPDMIPSFIKTCVSQQSLAIRGIGEIGFDMQRDIVFQFGESLPAHANGMKFSAIDAKGQTLLETVCYSTGGGFVLTEQEIEQQASQKANEAGTALKTDAPYPFKSATQMLEMGRSASLSIARMKQENELARGITELDQRLDSIWQVMSACIDRGLIGKGLLPGALKIERRAAKLFTQLVAESGNNHPEPHIAMDWLSVYAIAVNEENAAGGRIVTAPTNGAAGVIPSVLRYYMDHCNDPNQQGVRDFLLTAAAIGGVIRHNASISGAEVGCQGEVGSAAAMAAAGFAAANGGTNEQIENAAEIALEHHLGMTCDPIGGLVQVPCIERNALGAVKAVTAASLALRGDGGHFVPLDSCIETMRQTGFDMKERYKETSRGGLAVNVVEC